MDGKAWIICGFDSIPMLQLTYGFVILKLEDLYVKPEHRNLGAGKAFFGQLGKIAQEKVTHSL